MARIEDGEIIEGGIECPNCGDEMRASDRLALYVCHDCGYAESR